MLAPVGHRLDEGRGLALGLRALRVLAAALLCAWLAWNALNLSIGRIPPSILTALTGIPSPTTGGSRAVVALWHGDVAASLRYSPLAVPVALLFGATLGRLAWSLLRGGGPRIPACWLHAWLALLGVAWVAKLAVDLLLP